MVQLIPKALSSRAAVAWEPNHLTVETIEVLPPKAGEVRIKMVSTSLCHSDVTVLNGLPICRFEMKFPVVLGHEGAGVVESVGSGVESVSPGDYVIPVSVAQCDSCTYCKNPSTNMCSSIVKSQCSGLMPDSTSRFRCKGKELFHFLGCSTFSEYTVVPEIAVCKINKQAPLDVVGLLGCGFPTGYGSVVNTAKVTAGSSCAVFGLGAIGLSAVIGCKRSGADRIIVIDTNSAKFALARTLGATECINPVDCDGVVERLEEIVKDGCDFTFECVGSENTMNQALAACSKGSGVCVLNGILPSFQKISIDPYMISTGRTLRGAILGGLKLRQAIPELVEEYLAGFFPLDALITHRMPFDSIKAAFELLSEGKTIRTMLSFN